MEDQNWQELINKSKNLTKEPVSLYKYYGQYSTSLLYNQFMFCTGWWHWYDFITDKIILGAMPIKSHINSRNDLLTLKELNVDAVLSVVECYENHTLGYTYSPILPKEWEDVNIQFLQIPIPDFTTIDINKVNLCVEFINYIISSDKRIYLSCRVGKNRSTLVLMCYFVKYFKLSVEEAYLVIKKKRVQVQNKHFKILEEYQQMLYNDF